MTSVSVNPLTGEVGTPAMLFCVNDSDIDPDGWAHGYDVTPDGARFLIAKRMERPGVQPLVVVLNCRPDVGARAASAK